MTESQICRGHTDLAVRSLSCKSKKAIMYRKCRRIYVYIGDIDKIQECIFKRTLQGDHQRVVLYYWNSSRTSGGSTVHTGRKFRKFFRISRPFQFNLKFICQLDEFVELFKIN